MQGMFPSHKYSHEQQATPHVLMREWVPVTIAKDRCSHKRADIIHLLMEVSNTTYGGVWPKTTRTKNPSQIMPLVLPPHLQETQVTGEAREMTPTGM